jgi:hypothetical protein
LHAEEPEHFQLQSAVGAGHVVEMDAVEHEHALVSHAPA